ncbi:MAG: SPFH domain-containing protein [Clostridia bacterium]|nr:SPFH domain-containing protein [Clostridia bacterium]
MRLLTKKQTIQVKFGVPYFDVFDPRFTDFSVPVAVRGAVSFRVKKPKKFLKLYARDCATMEEFKDKLRVAVIRYAKDCVANLPLKYNLPVVQIERRIGEVSEVIRKEIASRIKKNFGLIMCEVDVTSIELNKTADGYYQLKAVTQDVVTAKIEAQTEIEIKDMYDRQRIQAQDLEETLRLEREKEPKKSRAGLWITLAGLLIIGGVLIGVFLL